MGNSTFPCPIINPIKGASSTAEQYPRAGVVGVAPDVVDTDIWKCGGFNPGVDSLNERQIILCTVRGGNILAPDEFQFTQLQYNYKVIIDKS